MATLTAAAVSGLAGCQCAPQGPVPSAAEARVLFVGVDGASWKVIYPLIMAGELPNLSRFVRQGAYSVDFDVVSPHSPIAWTSMATGRGPEAHGIVDYVAELPNGRRVPATSTLRKAKAIWEIATAANVSVGVAGWWASWPAEEVDGWVVTDHAVPSAAEFWKQDGTYWTADIDELRRMNRDVFPPAIAELVRRQMVTRENLAYDDFQARAKLSPVQLQLLQDAPWYQRTHYSLLKLMYATDLSLVRATKALAAQSPTRLTMVYLRGPDPVQHYAWDLVEPQSYTVEPPYLARDRGIVEGVYRYVDTFLGELVETAGENTWVLVASDHGAEPAPEAVGPVPRGRPGAHTHAAKGVFFLTGPGVREGELLKGVGPYDIMPTILWLMGLPISEELEGRPLTEAFEQRVVASRQKKTVPSYGQRETGEVMPSVADEAMLEGLRSLGYIE